MSGLLKFITCGSVDDGKSTLIGHILYDSKLLYADQEKALELDSKVSSDYVVVIDAQPMDVANADTTAVDASDDTEDAQQAGAAAVASGQNSGTMIWIVLLVIAVILAGAGIVLVKKGKKKEE